MIFLCKRVGKIKEKRKKLLLYFVKSGTIFCRFGNTALWVVPKNVRNYFQNMMVALCLQSHYRKTGKYVFYTIQLCGYTNCAEFYP